MRPLRGSRSRSSPLVAAVFLAMLASDLRSWQRRHPQRRRALLQSPGGGDMDGDHVLPFEPLATGSSGIDDQLAFRHAARRLRVPCRTSRVGFDNCYSESRARADLETTLTDLARGPNRAATRRPTTCSGSSPSPTRRRDGRGTARTGRPRRADFQSAVQLDPSNAAAKFNLEWLLRQLAAHGVRARATAEPARPERATRARPASPPGKGY